MSRIYNKSVEYFANNPEKIFFYDLKQSLSGRICLDVINQINEYLSSRKIQTIALGPKNTIYWPLWYIAADKLCNYIYMFNQRQNPEQAEHLMEKYNIQCYVSNPSGLKNNCIESLDRSKEINKSLIKPDCKRADILFTTGTTGLPKGVIIEESAYIHVVKCLIKKLKQNQNHLELLSMPFSHSFGLARLRCVLMTGGSAVITDGLKNFPEIYKFSKSTRISGLSLVPAAIEIIKKLLKSKIEQFSKNIDYMELGSSAISGEVRKWLRDHFHDTKIIHHYGMTEASRAFIRERGQRDDFNSPNNWIGDPLDGCDYSINKNDLQEYGYGELRLKGLNLFQGYLDTGQLTNKDKNGWLKTGDLCKVKNSKVLLIGRVDNQLNVGGEKFQSEEIEQAIENIEGVKICVTFSIPDEILGNKIACIINTNSDASSSIIKKRIRKTLSIFSINSKNCLIKFTLSNLLTKNGKKIRRPNILLNK
tara:strand:- start:4661 stop:6091 length:1431 start_codon:yes stop_codon:yes gene_type:complete